MRKFLPMLMVTASAGISQAIEIDTSRMAVSINPLGLVFGTLGVEVEFQSMRVEDKFVPQLGVSVTSYTAGHRNITAFGISAGAKIFSNRVRLSDWFGEFGVGLGFLTDRDSRTGERLSTVYLSPFGVAGYRWLIEEKFQIDAGAGAAVVVGVGHLSLAPILKLALGYRF